MEDGFSIRQLPLAGHVIRHPIFSIFRRIGPRIRHEDVHLLDTLCGLIIRHTYTKSFRNIRYQGQLGSVKRKRDQAFLVGNFEYVVQSFLTGLLMQIARYVHHGLLVNELEEE